jgi:Zn-dependent protease with chaperone function
MENFSDSAQLGATPTNPATDFEQSLHKSLNEGLQALKQKDYIAAIAYLETVQQQATRPSTVLKAQMGLVKAYRETGKVEQAIALCKTILTSPSQQSRSWAAQTLANLARQHPQANSALHEAPSPRRPGVSVNPATTDQATAEAEPAAVVPPEGSEGLKREADETGFVPFDATPAIDRPAAKTNASVSAVSRTVIQFPVKKAETTEAEQVPPDQAQLDQHDWVNPFVLSFDVDAEVDSGAWKQAGRAQRWTPLGTVKQWRLWLVQAGTAIALFGVIRAVLEITHLTTNAVFSGLRLYRFVSYSFDPTGWIIGLLMALFVASPWLLDFLLRQFYGLKSLPLSRLEAYSPEAIRVLKRICGQRRCPVPTLGILQTRAPLVFTYGHLPHKTQIVVTQGVLEQLADDEIAAIFAGELGHVVHWDFALLSWVALVMQLPFLLYWQVAEWGDRQHNPILRGVLATVAAIAYGLYRVLRWAGLWLSRLRVYYSDRTAVETTGNPNGLTRALLKMAIGTAAEIRRQRQTSYLLESFELLTPVGHQTALTLGSLYTHAPLQVLEWDRSNPYRNWLAINNAHPPLGDRLQLLTVYARHWRLEPELDLTPKSADVSSNGSRRFRLQAAPFLGLPAGILIALALWLIGGLAELAQLRSLDWLWGDRSLLIALIPIGFSVGTFLRINPFFPDIKPSHLNIEPPLPDLLENPAALPIDSLPVKLQGKLLGRQGMSNWLGQDLLLDTESGLIKLHHCSQLGLAGNLLPQSPRPDQLVNRSVTVTGWFRRGATPWIDIELLQTQRNTAGGNLRIQSAHPIWSTLLASIAAVWGAYLIVRGGS